MQVTEGQAVKALYIIAISLVMYAHSSVDTGSCGEKFSTRLDQDVFSKHRLRSRVVDSQPINRPFECYVKCMKNCRCASYNVCNKGKLCELNSEKKENNISLYEQSDECDYHEYQFTKQQSSGCRDPCCSTSKPCLNGGRCEASCMKNGRRFHCACAEGNSGDRCENFARSCGFYANSPNRTHGLRLIYAPDNTTYRAFCHFDQFTTLTLGMSYSRDNDQLFDRKPLTSNYPVSEDSQNWQNYRLSFVRMAGLRDVATKWRMSCSYQLQGLKPNDVLVVKNKVADPLKKLLTCYQADKVRVKGHGCDFCIAAALQSGNAWHMNKNNQDKCKGFAVLPTKVCGATSPSYFGKYKPNCYNEEFTCTTTGESTTQFWFIHER